MNNTQIGENAGTVWRVLHDRKHSWEELVKITALHPLELAAAIGWQGKAKYVSHQNGVSFTLRCIMNVIIESTFANSSKLTRSPRTRLGVCQNG